MADYKFDGIKVGAKNEIIIARTKLKQNAMSSPIKLSKEYFEIHSSFLLSAEPHREFVAVGKSIMFLRFEIYYFII